jgi:hypothetical protein
MITLQVSPPTLRERVAIEIAQRSNPELRDDIRDMCRNDVAWFIHMFGWTFDPRPDVEQHNIPFILYPYQREYLEWMDRRIERLEDGVIEKSRDMGVTWVTMAWLVHKWLFQPGFQALIGSRKEDMVDNWTLDSHFGKIQYYVDRLPAWMKPRGYSNAEHRMKLKLINPENGNVIIGESANAEFSRQGRYTVVIFDEAAFWDNLESAWRAAGQATRTRLAISTPNMLNYFYDMRQSGMYPVLSLHYTLHPNKTAEWAAKQRGRMSAEDFAQELDISYHRSARGVVYPGFKNVPLGVFEWEKNMPLFTAWDFGVGDETAILWIAKNPLTGKYRVVDCYKNSDRGIEFYVPFILGHIPPDLDEEFEYTAEEKLKITQHAHYPTTTNFGDPDQHKRALANRKATSVHDVLMGWGIPIWSQSGKSNEFLERKTVTERGIREMEGVDEENCRAFYDAMNNARFPSKKAGSQSTSGTVKPIHDWTEAYRSAFEYFWVNVPPTAVFERPDPVKRKMAYDN